MYGMNWNGAGTEHVDFQDPSLVRTCCASCRIYPTASASYDARSAYQKLRSNMEEVQCWLGLCQSPVREDDSVSSKKKEP